MSRAFSASSFCCGVLFSSRMRSTSFCCSSVSWRPDSARSLAAVAVCSAAAAASFADLAAAASESICDCNSAAICMSSKTRRSRSACGSRSFPRTLSASSSTTRRIAAGTLRSAPIAVFFWSTMPCSRACPSAPSFGAMSRASSGLPPRSAAPPEMTPIILRYSSVVRLKSGHRARRASPMPPMATAATARPPSTAGFAASAVIAICVTPIIVDSPCKADPIAMAAVPMPSSPTLKAAAVVTSPGAAVATRPR